MCTDKLSTGAVGTKTYMTYSYQYENHRMIVHAYIFLGVGNERVNFNLFFLKAMPCINSFLRGITAD